MTLRLAFTAAILAVSTGTVLAQTPPPPPPGDSPAMQGDMPSPPPPPPPGGKMERERAAGDKGPRGGPHGRGPGGRDGASFHLMFGDRMVVVECGMEGIAPCIEASRPLIDIVGTSNGGPAARPPAAAMVPPPAPGDLMTPPVPNDAPMPVPGADAPPPAPAN
ncbi:hypothetical protein ASG43_12345 [Aureimonas sp. Leaf454]|uniref:hypothetical protein n=1 Tax=Aureimonas sp. Leaf454 TaxID=1736381 RepID=UPI0007005EF1|nr:hypothetical protein [Aureimonas sp. Leaf454]KQT45089.1 hypothetical protein ASG43_12345 [Aureimonas sp. Leaf454]